MDLLRGKAGWMLALAAKRGGQIENGEWRGLCFNREVVNVREGEEVVALQDEVLDGEAEEEVVRLEACRAVVE